MSYIRDGYLFISPGRKDNNLGRCVYLVNSSKRISFKNIKFPKEYHGKRVRLKVEILPDNEGMPKKKEKTYTKEEMLQIKKKIYGKGYRKGFQAGKNESCNSR